MEVEPFGSARPFPAHESPAAQMGAKGSGAYVEFDVPGNAIPTPWVSQTRNTAVIPAEMPLSLEGLHPRFVRVRWWQFWKW